LPRVNGGRITGFEVTPEGTRRYTKFSTPDGVTHDIDGIEDGVPYRVSSSGAKEYYNASADAPGRVGSWQNQRPEATVDLEKEWKDATRNLRAMSARDWTNATMSMANGFVTGASWDQMMRTNPILGQLSALMMAKSGALAASIGPAFMVGYTAYMAYQAFRDEPSPGALGYFTAGGGSKRKWAPPEVLSELGHNGLAMMRVNYHPSDYDANSKPWEEGPETRLPTVEWYNAADQKIGEETLDVFYDRTGMLPMSFRGSEARLFDGLSAEVQGMLEDRKISPSYMALWKDGTVIFYNKDNNKTLLLSPEVAMRNGLGANAAQRPVSVGDDADDRIQHGESSENASLADAVSLSGLTETQITTITDGLGESERAFFLRRLANSEPISDTDIDFIFGRQSGGGYRYNASWEQFHRLDEQNLINRRRADLGSD